MLSLLHSTDHRPALYVYIRRKLLAALATPVYCDLHALARSRACAPLCADVSVNILGMSYLHRLESNLDWGSGCQAMGSDQSQLQGGPWLCTVGMTGKRKSQIHTAGF